MKRTISLILTIVLAATILITCTGCASIGYNKQLIDLNYHYNYAFISLMNGEIVEGPISSWNDYTDSDMVQVVFTDGNIYYTHSSNAVLIFDPNL